LNTLKRPKRRPLPEFYEDDDIELELAANPKDPNAPKPEGGPMSQCSTRFFTQLAPVVPSFLVPSWTPGLTGLEEAFVIMTMIYWVFL